MEGVDPNAERQAELMRLRASRKNACTVGQVLDKYEALKLVQLRKGGERRRSLDGKKGILGRLSQSRACVIDHVANLDSPDQVTGREIANSGQPQAGAC